MKQAAGKKDPRSGSALVTVMGLVLLGTIAAASVATSTNTRLRQARVQTSLEQAFYLAQAGAERAASYIAANNAATTLSGNLGAGSFRAVITATTADGSTTFRIASTGTVHGVSRGINVRGLQSVTWARFALWYNRQAVDPLWIVGGEVFKGPVYATCPFQFHSYNVASKGQAHFYEGAATHADSEEYEQNPSVPIAPIFDKPLQVKAPIQTMSTVDFGDMLANSSLTLYGPTTITISGTTMYITNSRKNWNNYQRAVPDNGLVYIKKATSGTADKTANLTVKAPNGLQGRVTLVAENDILITDHVKYKRDPRTIPSSTDALGLIANRSVVVETSAPDNLNIFAHIICKTGGFGVKNHDDRYAGARGTLTVYGGIVNECRNAVGTTRPTGYLKNYIYDTRFATKPPPKYPILENWFSWEEWDG